MKSFICGLLGAVLLSSVLALHSNRFSPFEPFAQDASFMSGWSIDDKKVKFNQTEISKKSFANKI